MSRFARSAHPRIAPCRPRIERLEPRRVRWFAAVAVDPAPGAHLTTPPAVLTVTFDHPIDPTSLGLGDIQLDEVDGSGGLTSIDGATETVGPRDDQLILTPGQPLSPGHYGRRPDRRGPGPRCVGFLSRRPHLPFDLHIPGPVLRGALAITRVGPEGTFPLDPGSPDAIGGSDDAALQPGVYSIQLSAIGADPVNTRYVLKAIMLPYEQWPEWASLNRIGQGPTLSLRPIQPPMMGLPPPATPPPSTSTPVSPSMPLVSTLPVGPMATLESLASTVSSPGDRASPSTNSAPRGEVGRVSDLSSTSTARQGPSGLFVGLGGDFVGRPSPFDRIVGPATSGTSRGEPRHPTASGSGSESARDSTLPTTIAWMGPSPVESIIKRAMSAAPHRSARRGSRTWGLTTSRELDSQKPMTCGLIN